MIPQEFVDTLNMRTMPQLGYARRNDRWERPNRLKGWWALPNGTLTSEKLSAKELGKELCEIWGCHE